MMNPFNIFRKKKPIDESFKYPHEIFPEILHWERGDWLVYDVSSYYRFMEVKENGDCIIECCSNLEIWSIRKLKFWDNQSLINRRIRESTKNNKYADFIRDFNSAYREIQS